VQGKGNQRFAISGSLSLELAVDGKTTFNILNLSSLTGGQLHAGLLEMNIGGSEGFSMNWGTKGTDISAGAIAGAAEAVKTYREAKQQQESINNANRITLPSDEGKTLGKPLTDAEAEELLEAQEEAGKIAEAREQEEAGKSDIEETEEYQYDEINDEQGTIGVNPQEYDFDGTIGRDKIEIEKETYKKPADEKYGGAIKELIGEQDIHIQLYGDDDVRALYLDFNNQGKGFDLEFGTGQVELPSLEFNLRGRNIRTYGTIEVLTGSSGAHFDNSGVCGEAGGYMIKYAQRVDLNTKNNSYTGGLNLYLGGAGWGLKLGSKTVIKLPGLGVDVFGEYNKKK